MLSNTYTQQQWKDNSFLKCCSTTNRLLSHENNLVTALFNHQYCYNLLTRLNSNDNNSEQVCSINIAFSCFNNRCCLINVVETIINNIVRSTTLFSRDNRSSLFYQYCFLLFQQPWTTVVVSSMLNNIVVHNNEQHCSFNNNFSATITMLHQVFQQQCCTRQWKELVTEITSASTSPLNGLLPCFSSTPFSKFKTRVTSWWASKFAGSLRTFNVATRPEMSRKCSCASNLRIEIKKQTILKQLLLRFTYSRHLILQMK